MNTFILFLSSLLFTSYSNEPLPTAELQNDCTQIRAVKSKDEKGIYSVYYERQYDDQNREIHHDLYYDSGQLKWAYDYKYNESGWLSKRIRYDEKNDYDGYYELKYDEKGNLTDELFFDKNDRLLFKMIYKNNAEGQPIRYDYFNAAGKFTEYWTFEYDEEGRNSVKNIYSASGKLDSRIFRYYDERGNEWKYIRKRPGGEEMYTFYYSYECD